VVGGVRRLALAAMGASGAVGARRVGAMTLAGVNAFAYSTLGVVRPLAASRAAVLVIGLFKLTAGWFAEGRTRRAMVQLFGEYVSPQLVEQMARDPFGYRIAESTNRELTILFADIRGFTRIAETMEPAALRDDINTFLTRM